MKPSLFITRTGAHSHRGTAIESTGPAGAMPTLLNTGPTVEPEDTISAEDVITAGGATGKIIVGDLLLSMALQEELFLEDCVVPGTFLLDVDFGNPSYSLVDYPLVNLTRTRFEGTFVSINAVKLTADYCLMATGMGMCAPCPECAGVTYGLERENPWVVSNSWFKAQQGVVPEHTEGAHIAGTGQGMYFSNTRFSVDGPINGTQTGAIFCHVGNSEWDDCHFDYNDTGQGAYYTVYIYGTGSGASTNYVRRARIQSGVNTYIYPDTPEDPVIYANYIACRDFDTDELLDLP